MKSSLRDYQTEALAKFLQTKRGIIAFAPGLGKTILACAAIEHVKGKALVIVPTVELRVQWERVVKEEIPKSKVTVVSYALAIRKTEEWFEQFTIIVADEAHHLQGSVFKKLLIPMFKADYGLGLSATPPGSVKPNYNPDERRFFKQKRPEALQRDANLVLDVLPVLYTRTFEEGRSEGHAAPIKLSVVKVPLTELERREYEKLSEEIRAVLSKAGSLERAVAWRGDLFQKRKMLTSMVSAKYAKLADIIGRINEADEPARILVWGEFIEGLERAEAVLKAAHIKCAVVHGELPKKKRAQVFADWGTKFQVLLAAKLFEEGIDFPTLTHGVLIAGARTSRQNTQRLGRLLRPGKGKTAQLHVIVAENTTDERIPALVAEIVK